MSAVLDFADPALTEAGRLGQGHLADVLSPRGSPSRRLRALADRGGHGSHDLQRGGGLVLWSSAPPIAAAGFIVRVDARRSGTLPLSGIFSQPPKPPRPGSLRALRVVARKHFRANHKQQHRHLPTPRPTRPHTPTNQPHRHRQHGHQHDTSWLRRPNTPARARSVGAVAISLLVGAAPVRLRVWAHGAAYGPKLPRIGPKSARWRHQAQNGGFGSDTADSRYPHAFLSGRALASHARGRRFETRRVHSRTAFVRAISA
jgi:hypothetical protein